MKLLLGLIIGVVIILLMVFVNSGAKGVKNIQNPINSIMQDGCMGFKLGDPESFLRSRFRHLGWKMNYCDALLGHYIMTESVYNNIQSIEFDINIDKVQLSTIIVWLKPEQTDIGSLVDIIKRQIESVHGYADVYDDKQKSILYIWYTESPQQIHLYYHYKTGDAFICIVDNRLKSEQ